MAWKVHDEFIDLAQAKHVVIFRNSDLGPAAEHHLVHNFKLPACPHCGHLGKGGEPIDFQKHKVDTLVALNDHHKTVMQYKEKHPNVRVGDSPKP